MIILKKNIITLGVVLVLTAGVLIYLFNFALLKYSTSIVTVTEVKENMITELKKRYEIDLNNLEEQSFKLDIIKNISEYTVVWYDKEQDHEFETSMSYKHGISLIKDSYKDTYGID